MPSYATNVNTPLGNHFRFVIDALPDLSFFAQNVAIPEVSAGTARQPTPFTHIPQVGDHLDFGHLSVTYLIDSAFKNYFSLFYWLKGYGFPQSYDDVTNFTASRQRQLGPRPTSLDIQKTNAVCYVLTPDTDATVAEIAFSDVFPTALGQVTFDTTDGEAPILRATVTFLYTNFDVRLIQP